MAIKTLAIRLEEDVHALLVLLAQLDDVSLTEEIRRAIEGHIARKRSEPDFAERAQAILAEIDQEAKTRRDAIQALFVETGEEQPEPSGRQPRKSTGRKGGTA